MEPIKLLTIAQVAELLGLDRSTVTAHVNRGNLTAIDIGTGTTKRHYRFTREAVDEFLARLTTKPKTQPRRAKRAPVPDFFG